MNPLGIWRFLVEVVNAWLEDKASRLGAALAYYSVFSLAPLLVLAIGLAGLVFVERAARGGLVRELESTVGRPAATAIEGLVKHVSLRGESCWATTVGLLVMLFGAS